MADPVISPDMALVVAGYIDPANYHKIVTRNGHKFLTSPSARRIWEYFDPETGAFDEISLFQGDPVAYDSFQKATEKFAVVRDYQIDLWIKHCRRKWQVEALTAATQGLEDLDPDEQLSLINNVILEMHKASAGQDSDQELAKALEDIDRLSRGERPNNVFGWPIPWMMEFDDLQQHEFVVVGGRPGTGKSAFMGQLAYQYAKQGRRVLYLSLEMTPSEIYKRFAAHEVGFGIKRLDLNGRGAKFKAAFQEITRMDNLRISVKTTLAEILAEINTERIRGLDVVFIDYLQLIQGAQGRSRIEELSSITRALKCITMGNLPVVVGSQLNREGDGGKPLLSHLRESGSIEQDADRVFLLYADDKATYITQAKLRNGPRHVVTAHFEGEIFTFKAKSKWDNQ